MRWPPAGRRAEAYRCPCRRPRRRFSLRLRRGFGVKLIDQPVDEGGLLLEETVPGVGVPQFGQFAAGPSLLLDPGEVLEVVDRLPVPIAEFAEMVAALVRQRAGMVADGVLRAVRSPFGAQFLQPRTVQIHRIGEDREDDIALPELEVFRRLYGGEDIADPRDSEPREPGQNVRLDPQGRKGFAARRFVEEPEDSHAVLVVDRGDSIGVAHVVDPGDMLVPDSLDSVLAEAVLEQGGALEGLACDDPQVGELLLQEIACGDRSRRARRRNVGGGPERSVAQAGEHFRAGRPGDAVVEDRVPEFLELIEDQDKRVLLQLPALVVDLLHVGFAARGDYDFGADAPEPFEALARHLLRKDGDALAAEDGAIECAAAAVVAG